MTRNNLNAESHARSQTSIRVIAALAGLTVGAFTAAAAPGQASVILNRLAVPSAPHEQTTTSSSTHSTFEIINLDGNDRFELVIRDDDVVAKMNGVRVADDLVVRKGGKVIILGRDGDVIKEFSIEAPEAPLAPPSPSWSPGSSSSSSETSRVYRFPGNSNAPSGWTGAAAGRLPFAISRDNSNESASAARPPVMLGVLLESPSEALRAQLGVSEHAIVIERVLDDLPASKAGLQQWDIIVEIDGKPVDQADLLGKILMESKPGDPLKLVTIRGGKKIERVLKLEAYDGEKLGNKSVTITTNVSSDARFPGDFFRGGAGGGVGIAPMTKDKIAEIVEQLIEKTGPQGMSPERVSEMVAALREQLGAAEQTMGIQAQELRRAQNQFFDKGRLIINDEDERKVLFDDMQARLSTLESELQGIEDRLDERWSKLERSIDRMFDKVDRLLEKADDDRD